MNPTELSVASAAVQQGSTLNFPLTLTSALSTDVTVHYVLHDGTAVAAVNYTDTSGTVIIPAGSTTGTITVPTLEDGVEKLSSAFSVVVTSVD